MASYDTIIVTPYAEDGRPLPIGAKEQDGDLWTEADRVAATTREEPSLPTGTPAFLAKPEALTRIFVWPKDIEGMCPMAYCIQT